MTSNIDGHWDRTPGVGPKLVLEKHGVQALVATVIADDLKMF